MNNIKYKLVFRAYTVLTGSATNFDHSAFKTEYRPYGQPVKCRLATVVALLIELKAHIL